MKDTAISKRNTIITTVVLILLIGIIITGTAHAKSKLTEIASDKTYKSFDLNNDGKKDKLKVKTVKTYVKNNVTKKNIYINGKKQFSAHGCKGANIFVFTQGKKSIVLNTSIFGDSGRSVFEYIYRGGKYKEKDVSAKGTFWNDLAIVNNKLMIESQPKGGWWTKSFYDNDRMPFKTVQSYKLKNGKLKKTKRYPYVALNDYSDFPAIEFESAVDFKTGKKISSIKKKDGPSVKQYDDVTFISMVYRKNKYYYKIMVEGKAGWFKDSKKIYFY